MVSLAAPHCDLNVLAVVGFNCIKPHDSAVELTPIIQRDSWYIIVLKTLALSIPEGSEICAAAADIWLEYWEHGLAGQENDVVATLVVLTEGTFPKLYPLVPTTLGGWIG